MSQQPIIINSPPDGSLPVRRSKLGAPGKRRALSMSSSSSSYRRASVAGLTPGTKAERRSKTTQKLVVLPSAPQTKPFPVTTTAVAAAAAEEEEEVVVVDDDDLTLGHETDGGIREYKSAAERMTKAQRKHAGHKRIAAYCVAESFRMKLLSPFLKREHNVSPRTFDEAVYAMYHLPLLPGYGPNANVRSAVSSYSSRGRGKKRRKSLGHLTEAEENGYQGSYFPSHAHKDGYISDPPLTAAAMAGADADGGADGFVIADPETQDAGKGKETDWSGGAEEDVAEVVFFEYGVVVFFGLQERQEKQILEDVDKAGGGIVKRMLSEGDWEIEECHFQHDPCIAYPRIYNDFFTLKSRSHLLKLSIAHGLAQSTLLARYEATAQQVLSSPLTLSIPRQLAENGALRLRRHEALKLTGRLFKLRRDVNLVSNVLDVPELFWSEASLRDLYSAVREYMEIKPRVEALNEKLSVASDFLDAIHDHLNNNAMDRITWIVIWLIVVAIIVELGEIIARLVFHSASTRSVIKSMGKKVFSRLVGQEVEALRTL